MITIQDRSFKFGVEIVKLTFLLPKSPAGYALASQIVRSGTSIGANIEEAQGASSKKDFVNKMQISLKEARETYFWLKILRESKLVQLENISYLLQECEEVVKILITIVKNSKLNK